MQESGTNEGEYPLIRLVAIRPDGAATKVEFELLDESHIYVSFEVAVPVSDPAGLDPHTTRQAYERLRDRLQKMASQANHFVQ